MRSYVRTNGNIARAYSIARYLDCYVTNNRLRMVLEENRGLSITEFVSKSGCESIRVSQKQCKERVGICAQRSKEPILARALED